MSLANSSAMLSSGSPLHGKKVSVSRSGIAGWRLTCEWEVVIDDFLAKHLSGIIYIIGLSAGLGTTFSLALLSDLLGLATFHLYVFYVMSTAVFSFHVKAMGSLYNLFRGIYLALTAVSRWI